MQGMDATPEEQLKGFVAKFEPAMGKLIRACQGGNAQTLPESE